MRFGDFGCRVAADFCYGCGAQRDCWLAVVGWCCAAGEFSQSIRVAIGLRLCGLDKLNGNV